MEEIKMTADELDSVEAWSLVHTSTSLGRGVLMYRATGFTGRTDAEIQVAFTDSMCRALRDTGETQWFTDFATTEVKIRLAS